MSFLKKVADSFFPHYKNDLHVLRTHFRKSFKNESVQNSWERAPVGLESHNFQDWFNSTSSNEQTSRTAKRDLFSVILEDIPIDENWVVCEIGFGGGRLLAEIAKETSFAYGIDIHNNFDQTAQYLGEAGVDNFELIDASNKISLPQIDLFYSFIVIQHFEKIEILHSYLTLIKHHLTANGQVVLWYAKLETRVWGNYVEISQTKFRKRECSLYIHPNEMEKIVKSYGFKVFKHKKRNKIGDEFSMQSKIVFGH